MILDDLPNFLQVNYTDKDGNLTPNALMYNDQLFRFLLSVVNSFQNGLTMPSKTTAQITAYGADTSVPFGTVWFNTDTSKLNVKTAAGTIEKITSTV